MAQCSLSVVSPAGTELVVIPNKEAEPEELLLVHRSNVAAGEGSRFPQKGELLPPYRSSSSNRFVMVGMAPLSPVLQVNS